MSYMGTSKESWVYVYVKTSNSVPLFPGNADDQNLLRKSSRFAGEKIAEKQEKNMTKLLFLNARDSST